jgi:predicted GIY-YIG superfamily endonuclease
MVEWLPVSATFYVYSITHTNSGRVYIGKTRDPAKRWCAHRWHSTKSGAYADGNMLIARAIRKHGASAFEFVAFAAFETEAEAFEAEKYWIRRLDTTNRSQGYNLSTGGEGPAGRRWSAVQHADVQRALGWSAEDIGTLRQFCGRETAAEIGRRVGRRPGAVAFMARKLGLRLGDYRPSRSKWSEADLEVLRRFYGTEPLKVTAVRLARCPTIVCATAARLGLGFAKAWSVEQVALLHQLYGLETCSQIGERLGKSVDAVQLKAARLGLRAATKKSPKINGTSRTDPTRPGVGPGEPLD